MFQILKIIILPAVIFVSNPIISRGTETYFIDNQPVLLYKTRQFSKKSNAVTIPPVTNINTLTLYRVNSEAAHRLKTIGKHLGITLEGKINGLSDGRIALHPIGNRIKGCNPLYEDPVDEKTKIQFPISLHLINTETHEVLAKYLMVWE